MRYLQLALYAEGATDEYFLSPLLQRVCEQVCAAEAVEPVEVSAVLGLRHREEVNDERRAERILSCATEAAGAWNVLFVHSDGGSDMQLARRQRVQPALDLLHRDFQNGRGVAIVPLRETEAWAICDGDALREVFGTTLPDDALGVPVPPHTAEAVRDPKAVLGQAFALTRPGGIRRRRGVSPMLGALGQHISIPTLRRVPAFQAFEGELTAALRQLRFL